MPFPVHQRLATAHNLNDSVETALLNFIRGAGLAGIIGMRNAEFGVRNDDVEHLDIGAQDSEPDIPHSALRIPHSALRIPHSIWRPLLFATRDEIMEYAHANQISWREDSSNASDDYSRNFLRHHIVPKMQELNPNFLHTAERNLYRLQETQENLAFLSRQFLGIEPAAGDLEGFSIDKQKLTQLPAPRQVLYDLLNPFGFTLEQARQIADNLNKTGFLIHSDAGWALLCDRNALLVAPPGGDDQASTLGIQKDDLMLRLEDGSALFFMATSPAKPYPDGIQAILVDAAKIQYPLKLRHWQKGDVFQPFGMGGQRQKLQNFFTHQKRSLFEKRDVWLLLNGDGAIIWIIGLRLDERFQIRENTLSALKITWSKP